MKLLFVEINRRSCRFFVFSIGKVVHAYVGYPRRANLLQEDVQPVDITKPEMLLDVVDAVEHHAQPFGQILLQEAANDIDEIVRECRARTKLGIDDLVVDLLLISILRTRRVRRAFDHRDRRSYPKRRVASVHFEDQHAQGPVVHWKESRWLARERKKFVGSSTSHVVTATENDFGREKFRRTAQCVRLASVDLLGESCRRDEHVDVILEQSIVSLTEVTHFHVAMPIDEQVLRLETHMLTFTLVRTRVTLLLSNHGRQCPADEGTRGRE